MVVFPSPSPLFCFEKRTDKISWCPGETRSELHLVARSHWLTPCDLSMNGTESSRTAKPFASVRGHEMAFWFFFLSVENKVGPDYTSSDNSRPHRARKNSTFTVDSGLLVRVGATGQDTYFWDCLPFPGICSSVWPKLDIITAERKWVVNGKVEAGPISFNGIVVYAFWVST